MENRETEPAHRSGIATCDDPPSQVGPYRILREIGRGGMGLVYLARDLALDREVAVKLGWPSSRGDSSRDRIIQEARAAARLDHPCVVRIYSAGTHEGRPYVAMEYAPGMPLSEILGLRGDLPEGQALEIARQVAEGLAAAHDAGLVHGDIKPSNIQITPAGGVKVMDFGISRSIGSLPEAGEKDCFVGTPEYASPEQAMLGELDGRSDIYSLGVLLFEMLTGKLPFGGRTPGAVLRARCRDGAPDPSVINHSVSKRVASLVLKMLSRDRDGRHGSARELAAEISGIPCRPVRAGGKDASAPYSGAGRREAETTVLTSRGGPGAARKVPSMLKAALGGVLAGIVFGAVFGPSLFAPSRNPASGGGLEALKPASSSPALIRFVVSAPPGEPDLAAAGERIRAELARMVESMPIGARIGASSGGHGPTVECRLISSEGEIWAGAMLRNSLGASLHAFLASGRKEGLGKLCDEVARLILKAILDNARGLLPRDADSTAGL